MKCGTGLMLVKTRRGVSRIRTKSEWNRADSFWTILGMTHECRCACDVTSRGYPNAARPSNGTHWFRLSQHWTGVGFLNKSVLVDRYLPMKLLPTAGRAVPCYGTSPIAQSG
ncbi:hypothetical protein ACJJTC_008510 [Scirpophaga incertulas]